MIADGIWEPSFYDDEIGWPELAADTARAWQKVPAATPPGPAIVTDDYGEASALELYGPGLGLPQP